jgi:hypothetical protein
LLKLFRCFLGVTPRKTRVNILLGDLEQVDRPILVACQSLSHLLILLYTDVEVVQIGNDTLAVWVAIYEKSGVADRCS